MFTIILYLMAAFFLGVSFFKDRKKTKMALIKAWKSFENILPQFLVILVVIGIFLGAVNEEIISKWMGAQSGWLGMLLAGVVGSITLIPAFVAFPLASALYQNGAGIEQIAVFVSTLMMVGIITLPLEMKYFGKKASMIRNSLAFVFSFAVALIIGAVIGS